VTTSLVHICTGSAAAYTFEKLHPLVIKHERFYVFLLLHVVWAIAATCVSRLVPNQFTIRLAPYLYAKRLCCGLPNYFGLIQKK